MEKLDKELTTQPSSWCHLEVASLLFKRAFFPVHKKTFTYINEIVNFDMDVSVHQMVSSFVIAFIMYWSLNLILSLSAEWYNQNVHNSCKLLNFLFFAM